MSAGDGPTSLEPAVTRPPVFVHIGAPKTGTTYLQTKLWHNRDQLRRDGVCYPGAGPAAHLWATLDLRRVQLGGVANPQANGSWRRMVAQLRAFGGAGIFDSELLSGARPEHVARMFADLDWADVHIVYTLRDMARTLPSAWQERLKNRQRETFADFLEIVHLPQAERRRTGNRFWHLNDSPAVLSRWAAHVPAAKVHVITLPPSGSDPSALWTRFARLVGIDPGRYEEPPEGRNQSLPAAEATVMRRLNDALGGEDFPWPVYDKVVKQYLAVELAGRRGPAIALPPAEYEWAVSWSRDMADFIRDRGFDVVGDLDELIPTGPSAGADPDTVDGGAQADAAVDGLAVLLRYFATRATSDTRTTALEAQVRRAENTLQTLRTEPPKQKVKRTLVELSDQVGWMSKAYGIYRKAKYRDALH